jgi:hypothetical protein
MKAVADTLAVARSNLIEQVSRRAKSRRPYRRPQRRSATLIPFPHPSTA